MADKFPSLGSIDKDLPETNEEFESDFLAREKELIGDEFQTEQDNEILADEDEEINNFISNFPEVGDDQPAAAVANYEDEDDDEEFEGFGSSAPKHKLDGESIHLKEWKERRELEISEREAANAKRKQDIVAKAQQTIDDFYENYNLKKEQHFKEILDEQETYLEKRDGFLKRGTLWNRVNELVDEVGVTPSSDSSRDKSRFMDLLKKLNDKENAPGAAGY